MIKTNEDQEAQQPSQIKEPIAPKCKNSRKPPAHDESSGVTALAGKSVETSLAHK